MAQRQVLVASKIGLHARPAARFVRTAAAAPMDITISKGGGNPVNAKSILAVLGLDARYGEVVVLDAEGEGADLVLDDLASVVTGEDG